MKENVRAAIIAAVSAYMQGEARRASSTMPTSFSPWRLFGLQELMRKRVIAQRRMRP